MKKILVVDDNEDVLALVTYILKKEGYLVFEASEMPAAMKIIRKETPDLLILDMILQQGGGAIEICRELRSDKEYRDIPVVIMTAKPEKEYKDVCKMFGVKEYINKPFDPADLVNRVKNALR